MRALQIAADRKLLSCELELTHTQTAMLKVLADGASMKDIAGQFGVSINTVHTHLRRAYRALNARGSNNAIAIAIRAQGPEDGGKHVEVADRRNPFQDDRRMRHDRGREHRHRGILRAAHRHFADQRRRGPQDPDAMREAWRLHGGSVPQPGFGTASRRRRRGAMGFITRSWRTNTDLADGTLADSTTPGPIQL